MNLAKRQEYMKRLRSRLHTLNCRLNELAEDHAGWMDTKKEQTALQWAIHFIEETDPSLGEICR